MNALEAARELIGPARLDLAATGEPERPEAKGRVFCLCLVMFFFFFFWPKSVPNNRTQERKEQSRGE